MQVLNFHTEVYDAIARLELENDITAPYFVRLCLSAEILPLSNAPSKKIYCNTERFKKRDDGEWYDEGIGFHFPCDTVADSQQVPNRLSQLV
jgi:hypothetical protein